MRSPKIRRYAVIIAMALMLASVVVLADVIYYYQGVITAQVSAPPLVFYSGASFTYCPSPSPHPSPGGGPASGPGGSPGGSGGGPASGPGGSPGGSGGGPASGPGGSPRGQSPPPCTYSLNSIVSGYASFTASPKGTGFTATIQLTNASYAYFYHALGLVVNTQGWLYVTNVTVPSSNQIIISKMEIIVQNAYTNQTVCSFTVINYSQPITSPTQACPLSTGPYYISVLVQPNAPLSTSQSETVTLYFGYNVAHPESVPLPPISG